MRTVAAIVIVAGLAALASGSTQLSQQVQNELTVIDQVPTQPQLDQLFAGQALPNLSSIAMDDQTDPGIRLRAIHALTKYCPLPCADTDSAHQSLVGLINANSAARVGSDLLVLRAAIEAIGPMRVGTDLDGTELDLKALLDHPSRDIRATTAHALRDLCNTQAIGYLRARYQFEATDQVRLAISEALRILGQPSPCQ